MNDNVVPLTNARRKNKRQQRQKHSTMCGSGFHKWKPCKEKQFDVKQGKLVTLLRCERCGETKVKAT
ncbi:hypothetical protein [Pleionea mediterranea]|uniref:Uncharacterized protein n=1 Tax=Pleionea mediterranea TaxID=523701 RepID=A0A316F965_9GAMM|nr:hypothetical protein [Pleionea mediterranea]PWK42830.1 hypothetical protein C8D97_11732 [Pleionea mediterranea]